MASTTTQEVVSGSNTSATEAISHLNTDSTVSKPPPDSEGSGVGAASKSEEDEKETKGEDVVVERPVVNASYVGWKQIGGWEERDELKADDLLLDLNRETALSNVLPDSAYGDWFHSVGYFFVGGFLSFLLGYFKFGLAPVFFIVVGVALLYRTSIKRYRASIRELVQKELTVQKVEDDYESMDWLNNFLDKFWPRIEPAASKMVVDQVNEELARNPAVPGFIQSLWVDQFTLGVKPPRIDLVKTFQNTDPDVAVMDWAVSFTPHDLSDLDAKQLKNYVNQRVVIKVKIFGISIPVIVQDIAFSAHVRVRMKMMTPFPHIETANVQLLDIPDIDFMFKMFGDTIFNWELMAIPGLLPLIKEMARKYAGPILLPPFSFQLNIPQLLSGSSLSIGVLELSVHNAKNLKCSRSSLDGEELSPYLEFSFNGKVVGKTATVKNTLNPVWDESMYILVSSFTDPLSITVYAQRENLKDRVLGRVQYNLSSLHDKPLQKGRSAKILNNSKPVGLLNFDLNFHPTLEPKKLPDGSVEELLDLNSGITKIQVEKAIDLNNAGEKKPSTYVEVYVNAKLVLTTAVVAKNANPTYSGEHETVITDRRRTRVKLVVKDLKGNIISSTVQSLNDLIDRTQVDKRWIPLQGGKGELKVTTQWKPVALDAGSDNAGYVPPIGVIRLLLNKAEGLRNLEKIGTIDPYARVLVQGNVRGRTNAADSTVDPIWNEAIYVTVSSPNQRISIECMDVETAGNDRTLGKFDIKTSDLFQKGSDDRYLEVINEDPIMGRLVSKKGPKGIVTYYISFYPSLPILSLEEIMELDSINESKKQLQVKKDIMKDSASSEKKAEIQNEETELKELEDMFSNKMKLDLGELLQYGSGVFAFTILGGELPQTGCYIQAFFDSGGHPKYVSPKNATKTVRPSPWGDALITELQWSVTTFRVTKNAHQNKAEGCLCELNIPTIELVKNCFYKPSIVTLTGDSTGKVMVQASWFPIVATRFPQSDLITNTGDLDIEIRNAVKLIAADRNGKSDPYVKLYIDDAENHFYKTKVQKKNLNPTWGESTTIQINNRVNNYLRIKVMDWDAGNSDDLIGLAMVALADINPDGDTVMDVPLTAPDGGDGGILYLTFRFAPRYTVSVSKVETKVADIATKGLSAGLHAGTSAIGTGLGAVGKLKKGILGGKNKDKDKQKVEE
ncbi:tricalbin Ecym_5368 [Eremothecium cymbalariae DBVPG|uniref:Tricalbin n=1 Tax=Eremothecium cymbalariae (strain CBS 270.75 / DBVPG 7215 / KCTC 17166 / NRRL Y-17582) TaxID=931890 RepID=I6NDI2_ERECY|nr:hypothetical protein Ecym_5368 [Eremothecium cymbalariae DBVPG\